MGKTPKKTKERAPSAWRCSPGQPSSSTEPSAWVRKRRRRLKSPYSAAHAHHQSHQLRSVSSGRALIPLRRLRRARSRIQPITLNECDDDSRRIERSRNRIEHVEENDASQCTIGALGAATSEGTSSASVGTAIRMVQSGAGCLTLRVLQRLAAAEAAAEARNKKQKSGAIAADYIAEDKGEPIRIRDACRLAAHGSVEQSRFAVGRVVLEPQWPCDVR